ncbi:aroma-sacti cluster domain-containing protein [Nonomuraea sp. H19]|uniref:aroma-sacti cluster domain-containing protein n=1 Tax=Nonomuraea sp. H19 TaxID=3452206 RepID=UPI003F89FED6
MTFNALDALRAAGIVTAKTSPAALGVLSELSESEVQFLGSLDQRIKAAMRPEVLAHSEEGNEDTPCLAGFSCGHFGSDGPIES